MITVINIRWHQLINMNKEIWSTGTYLLKESCVMYLSELLLSFEYLTTKSYEQKQFTKLLLFMVTDHVLYLEMTLQKSEKDLIFNHKNLICDYPYKN